MPGPESGHSGGPGTQTRERERHEHIDDFVMPDVTPAEEQQIVPYHSEVIVPDDASMLDPETGELLTAPDDLSSLDPVTGELLETATLDTLSDEATAYEDGTGSPALHEPGTKEAPAPPDIRVVIAGLDKNIEQFAREAALEKLEREKVRNGPLWKHVLKRVWQTLTHEYQLVKATKQAREEIIARENLREHQGESDQAWREATVERLGSDFGEKLVREQAGEKYKKLTVEHEADPDSPESMVRLGTLDLLRRYARDEFADRESFEAEFKELNNLWREAGISQDLIGEARIQASNMFGVAEQVKAAFDSTDGLDEIDRTMYLETMLTNTEIVVGEAHVGSAVEIKGTTSERLAERLRDIPFVSEERLAGAASLLGNELFVAGMLSVLLAAGKKGAAVVPGLGAAVVAGFRERRALINERSLMDRREDNDQTVNSAHKKQVELEETRYETRSVSELIEQIGNFYNEDGELNITDRAGLEAAIKVHAEINARIDLTYEGSRLINFGASESREDRRFDLESALAKLETDLRKAFDNEVAAAMLDILPEENLDDLLNAERDREIGALEGGMQEKDKLFNKLVASEVIKKMVIAGVTAAFMSEFLKTLGGIGHEIVAEMARNGGNPDLALASVVEHYTGDHPGGLGGGNGAHPEGLGGDGATSAAAEHPGGLGETAADTHPGGIGDTTSHPAGVGSSTSPTATATAAHPGGLGDTTTASTAHPGGLGNDTSHPGGLGNTTGAGGGDHPGGLGTDTAGNHPGGLGGDTTANHPGGLGGDNTSHPEGLGSDTSHPGGLGGETSHPGGLGGETDHPGGLGGETNHPEGLGNNGEALDTHGVKISDHAKLNLPNGYNAETSGSHVTVTGPDGKTFGLDLNKDGTLSQNAIDTLKQHGFNVQRGSDIVEGPPNVSHETVTSKEFVQGHPDMKKISIEGYMDQNTSAFDQNEQGGQYQLMPDGSVKLSVNMTSHGSYHGDQHIDYKEAARSGHLVATISAGRDTQAHAFVVTFDKDGHVILPAGSDARALFDEHGNFTGGYVHYAVEDGTNPDGSVRIISLATDVGKNAGHFQETITTPTYETVQTYTLTPDHATEPTSFANIETDHKIPPIIPIPIPITRRRLGEGEEQDAAAPAPTTPGTPTTGGPAGGPTTGPTAPPTTPPTTGGPGGPRRPGGPTGPGRRGTRTTTPPPTTSGGPTTGRRTRRTRVTAPAAAAGGPNGGPNPGPGGPGPAPGGPTMGGPTTTGPTTTGPTTTGPATGPTTAPAAGTTTTGPTTTGPTTTGPTTTPPAGGPTTAPAPGTTTGPTTGPTTTGPTTGGPTTAPTGGPTTTPPAGGPTTTPPAGGPTPGPTTTPPNGGPTTTPPTGGPNPGPTTTPPNGGPTTTPPPTNNGRQYARNTNQYTDEERAFIGSVAQENRPMPPGFNVDLSGIEPLAGQLATSMVYEFVRLNPRQPGQSEQDWQASMEDTIRAGARGGLGSIGAATPGVEPLFRQAFNVLTRIRVS